MPSPAAAPLDAIVVGLGAIGSATLHHLVRRGARVLGIDRFVPPHDRASSHGHSRLIRLCYYEHPDYVPLLHRAYELWHLLQAESRTPLIRITGGLYLGEPGDDFVAGSLRSAKAHALEHEMLDAPAVRSRFPQFAIPDSFLGFFEPTTGVLFPERAIAAHLDLASRLGARTLTSTRVLSWAASPSSVSVKTDAGDFSARTLILAAGPWMTALAPALPLRVTRQLACWFQPRDPAALASPAMPAWALGCADGSAFYGFPMFPPARPADPPPGGRGFKLALHKPGPNIDPDESPPPPDPAEIATLADFLARHIPAAGGPLLAHSVCRYTMSPDQHFILGRYPGHDSVLVASCCSGHGFKFAPVVGEALADMVTTGATPLPIEFLGLSRLCQSP